MGALTQRLNNLNAIGSNIARAANPHLRDVGFVQADNRDYGSHYNPRTNEVVVNTLNKQGAYNDSNESIIANAKGRFSPEEVFSYRNTLAAAFNIAPDQVTEQHEVLHSVLHEYGHANDWFGRDPLEMSDERNYALRLEAAMVRAGQAPLIAYKSRVDETAADYGAGQMIQFAVRNGMDLGVPTGWNQDNLPAPAPMYGGRKNNGFDLVPDDRGLVFGKAPRGATVPLGGGGQPPLNANVFKASLIGRPQDAFMNSRTPGVSGPVSPGAQRGINVRDRVAGYAPDSPQWSNVGLDVAKVNSYGGKDASFVQNVGGVNFRASPLTSTEDRQGSTTLWKTVIGNNPTQAQRLELELQAKMLHESGADNAPQRTGFLFTDPEGNILGQNSTLYHPDAMSDELSNNISLLQRLDQQSALSGQTDGPVASPAVEADIRASVATTPSIPTKPPKGSRSRSEAATGGAPPGWSSSRGGWVGGSGRPPGWSGEAPAAPGGMPGWSSDKGEGWVGGAGRPPGWSGDVPAASDGMPGWSGDSGESWVGSAGAPPGWSSEVPKAINSVSDALAQMATNAKEASKSYGEHLAQVKGMAGTGSAGSTSPTTSFSLSDSAGGSAPPPGWGGSIGGKGGGWVGDGGGGGGGLPPGWDDGGGGEPPEPGGPGWLSKLGDVGKRVAGLPYRMIRMRWNLRALQGEFLDPMLSARNAYLDYQQAGQMTASQYDSLGGISNVGSAGYNAAFMPQVLAARAQLAYGEQGNRVMGGLVTAGASLVGQTNVAAIGSLGNMMAVGAGGAGILGLGAVGMAAGAALGVGSWGVGQAGAYASDPVLRAQQNLNVARGQGFADLGAAFGKGANDLFASVLGGDAAQKYAEDEGTAQLRGQVVQALLGEKDQTGLTVKHYRGVNTRTGAVTTGDIDLRDQVTQQLFAKQYLADSSAGSFLDPTVRQTAFQKTFAMTGGLQAYAQAGGKSRLGSAFDTVTRLAGAGVDMFAATDTYASFLGVDNESIESAGYNQAFDMAATAFGGPNGQSIARLAKKYGGQQAALANQQRMAAQEITALSPDEYARRRDAINAMTDQASRDAAIRKLDQGEIAKGNLAGIGMTSGLAADNGSYAKYLTGLAQNTSAAGVQQFNRAIGRGSFDEQLYQTYTTGYGIDATSARSRITALAMDTNNFSAGAVGSAVDLYARSGFKLDSAAASGDIKRLSGLTEAGMGDTASQLLASKMAGKNLVYGSQQYQDELNKISGEWSSKHDTAGLIRSAQEGKDWAASSVGLRSAGMAIRGEEDFAGLTDSQRSIIVQADNVVVNTKMATGTDISARPEMLDIEAKARGGHEYEANVELGQVTQAAQVWANRQQYGGTTGQKLNQMMGWASGLSQGDFAMMMGADQGNVIAASAAYKRGLVTDERMNLVDLSDENSIYYGQQQGYHTKPTGAMVSARKQYASDMGLKAAGGAYDWNTLMGSSQQEISALQRGEEIKTREYDFALQQRQLSRSQATVTGVGLGAFVGGAEGKGQWWFEDQNRTLSRAQQDFSYQQQGKGLAIEGQQLQYSQGYQLQSMQIQRGHQVQEQQWGLQDIAFQRNLSAVEFGFSQIDADENIRYSTGRQRRVAMRHKEQASIEYSMQEGQRDREEDRAKERIKWADDLYQRELQNFEKTKDFANQKFAIEQQNYQKNREFLMQERSLEDQQRTIQRAIVLQEQQEQQASLTFHQNEKRTMDELSAAFQTAQQGASLLISRLQTLGQVSGAVNPQAQNYGASTNTYGSSGAYGATASGAQSYWSNYGGSGATFTAAVMGADGHWYAAGDPRAMGSGTSGQQLPSTHVGSAGRAMGGYTGDPSLRRYAGGGYTGTGATYEPAGIVHKGEYVVPQNGALVSHNPDMIDILRKILDKLTDIHREGGNVMIQLPGTPAERMQKGASLAQQVWS